MKRVDPFVWGIIILTIAIIGGIILAANSKKQDDIPQYRTDTQNRPKLSIGEKDFDFGKMKLSEVKTREVVIKNIGNKPLVVSDFITSCNCTFAQFVKGGIESPRFSMHRNPDWRGELAPNEEAIIRLIYEPRIMPVQGLVERQIIFRTNDTDNLTVNLGLTANVE